MGNTFAVGGVAHKMVIGPTGSGKSVLLAFLALQFRRYAGARVVIFDKGEGALAATMGVGGMHVELGTREGSLSFQPLADIDRIEERRWVGEGETGTTLAENGLEVKEEIAKISTLLVANRASYKLRAEASGLASATDCVPIYPFAPGLVSTITLWPRSCSIGILIIRT